jgi:hypothetical protein
MLLAGVNPLPVRVTVVPPPPPVGDIFRTAGVVGTGRVMLNVFVAVFPDVSLTVIT